MKILLVDDEQLARKHLKRLLEELGSDYQLVAEAANGEQAVAACNEHEVDLVLMDIHMPGINGIEAAGMLSDQLLPPAIIFTTAHTEYALSAFDVRAVDYLLKPIRRSKLLAALNKAAALTRPQVQAAGMEASYVISRARGGVQRIPLHSVFYLRADQKYVTARYPGGEVLLEKSLKSLSEQYPQQFCRIHRNALVNMSRVNGLEKHPGGQLYLTFNGIDDRLEVSRRHQSEVRKAIKQ